MIIKDNTASAYNNPLWDHFYIPNDSITKRFIDVLTYYESLPANFIVINEILESYGLPLLEIKADYIKPIKQIPLLSKLINKEYQTEESKSDCLSTFPSLRLVSIWAFWIIRYNRRTTRFFIMTTIFLSCTKVISQKFTVLFKSSLKTSLTNLEPVENC